MLKWNTVQQILDFCDGKIFVGIASNGTAATWKRASIFRVLRKYDNVEFRFTLWSHQPQIHNRLCGVDGALDCLGGTIRNTTKAGIKTAINIVVNTENITHVREIIEYAVKLGASHIEITYTYPRPNLGGKVDRFHFPSRSYYDLLQVLRPKLPSFAKRNIFLSFVDRYGLISSDTPFAGIPGFRRCGGGLHLEVTPGGNCYPCQLTIGNNEFKLGNVRSSNLEEIWCHKKLDCFRNHSWRNVSNDHCRKCDKLRNCGGGCIINAWLNTRNFGGGDPMCPRLTKGYTQ